MDTNWITSRKLRAGGIDWEAAIEVDIVADSISMGDDGLA